jgi:hypothetical protein
MQSQQAQQPSSFASQSSTTQSQLSETGGMIADQASDNGVLQKYPLLTTGSQGDQSEDMLFTGLDIVLIKNEELQVDLYKNK